jgi:hypothetical protein
MMFSTMRSVKAEIVKKGFTSRADRMIDRLGFGGFGSLFVHEWNVVGREDSRDVADHDACNAFNRLLGLVVYPRKDCCARRPGMGCN